MKALVATILVLVAAAPCLAHDTWLMPREPQVTEGKQATVELTSGMSFPQTESAIAADRVQKGAWRTGRAKGKLDKWEEGSSSLVMHLTAVGTGTMAMWLTLKPKDIELTDEDVEHYFEEIGASESVRRDWESREPGTVFKERYTKHAKSFMRVGDGGEDPTCLQPAGLAIELLPQSDPTALSVGDKLVVKAVRGGDDELEQFAVGIVCGATGASEILRTNES
ncbi:MAG TPA: DUF4198 domain-containing protein, partial [Candidatus Krumholzibacteria bacterium]|nr:DUF4198 domain-containing protein [Candidatus Krumholzibacteria bacterium]